MSVRHQVIEIRAEAPAAPAWGAPCTGCGLCCLAEPCPLGILISRRRRGACAALQWQEAERRYVCGVLASVQAPDARAAGFTRRVLQRLVRRWIGAGAGCDAHLVREDLRSAGDASTDAPATGPSEDGP